MMTAMRRSRWAVLALAVALVVLVGGGAVASKKWSQHQATAELCEQVRANAKAAPASVKGNSAGTVAILGDSWTSGWLMPKPTDGFAYLLARQQGWTAQIDGFAGSGFVSAGPCNDAPFRARVSVARGARLVIVEGGLNDLGDDLAALPEDAKQTLAALMLQAPTAQIVVVGPAGVPGRSRHDIETADTILATTAARTGARYVRTIEWPLETQSDGVHLTVPGAADFARRLGTAIKSPTS